MTGRSPLETGVIDRWSILPEEMETLAEVLRDGGFDTVAFVSSRTSAIEHSLGQGFASFTTSRTDRATMAAASQWLRRDFGTGRPVFLWIHLGGLEPSWEPKHKDLTLGAASHPDRFLDRAYKGPIDGSSEVFERVRSGEIELDARDVQHVIDLYDGQITLVVGRLVKFMREAFDFYRSDVEASETWARTVFVLTSPHGTELFERGRFGSEGSLAEGVLRVPLFMRHPDSLTGQRVYAEIVELADVMPTLLEWTGQPVPRFVQGRSLLALTDTHVEHAFEPRPAFAYMFDRVFSVRTPRWRMVWNPLAGIEERAPDAAPLPEVSLYDHDNDRLERHNVAARHPAVVEELRAILRVWRQRQSVRPRPVLRFDAPEGTAQGE
jgi:arylsulfatase A-like enzyme